MTCLYKSALLLAQTGREVDAAIAPQIAYILVFVVIAAAAIVFARNLTRARSPLMRVALILALFGVVAIAIVLLLN